MLRGACVRVCVCVLYVCICANANACVYSWVVCSLRYVQPACTYLPTAYAHPPPLPFSSAIHSSLPPPSPVHLHLHPTRVGCCRCRSTSQQQRQHNGKSREQPRQHQQHRAPAACDRYDKTRIANEERTKIACHLTRRLFQPPTSRPPRDRLSHLHFPHTPRRLRKSDVGTHPLRYTPPWIRSTPFSHAAHCFTTTWFLPHNNHHNNDPYRLFSFVTIRPCLPSHSRTPARFI
ncbi:hypothetical protein GGS23DRAFT_528251 [Durotheca rogersii]|uniref:uncharacterized protein n=1 Tax=Durotheca rogersii TaxID=419775 RepID=UPI00221FCBB3|nr:uncharacterized protein GGS23DRAFT_528251 [Durotheca rogersii]KAI5863329.1 hypothetical protein GGS23DRAFT_528251 [Durotheca rogersii]